MRHCLLRILKKSSTRLFKVRQENEELRALIKDHEAEIVELEKKIAAEKTKPKKSCCALI